MGIILPAFVIIFFTFEFGNEYKFQVGIIDKDDSYASEELVKVIDELEDVEVIKHGKIKATLLSHNYYLKALLQQYIISMAHYSSFVPDTLRLAISYIISCR